MAVVSHGRRTSLQTALCRKAVRETMVAGQDPGMRLPGAGNTITRLHTNNPQSMESEL